MIFYIKFIFIIQMQIFKLEPLAVNFHTLNLMSTFKMFDIEHDTLLFILLFNKRKLHRKDDELLH